jgi:hypothetical protein
MREWNPIGVAGIAEAADEYDSYVGKVYVMLMDDHSTAEEIAAYLLEIATVHMGLSNTAYLAERGEQTAKCLVSMRPEFETH